MGEKEDVRAFAPCLKDAEFFIQTHYTLKAPTFCRRTNKGVGFGTPTVTSEYLQLVAWIFIGV